MRVVIFIHRVLISICLIVFSSYVQSVAGQARYIYDDSGRLITVIDDSSNNATYEYEEVGNLLSITGNTATQVPQITSITPSLATQGDVLIVTITGDNLSGAEIETNNPGIRISNISSSKASITATFSISYQAVIGVSTVIVKTPAGSVSTDFTVNPAPPLITGLSPVSGPVSRLVTITGTGFSAVPSENIVSFNGTIAEIITATSTSILTTVPFGATSGLVTVTVNGLTSNGVNFTVLSSQSPPVITSITPNVGSVEGGSFVTIAGSGFTSDTKVYIGGNYPPDLRIIDSNTILIKTPPGSEGPADVLVTNINGDAFLPGGFTYLPGPNESILQVNPPLGYDNTPINTKISVLFTRPIDRTTVTGSSFTVLDNETNAPVPGEITFEFEDRAIFFKPSSPLSQNKTYSISITQSIRSSDGIPLDASFTGFFTTGVGADSSAPTVTVSPANGETVPYNSSVVFTFSEPINPVTINDYTINIINNGQIKEGEIAIGQDNRIVTFIPFSPFVPDAPVNVTLSSKVTDIAGNSIIGSNGPGTDLVFSFNAATNADNMPPGVLYIKPTDGTAGVNPNTSISVTFTEPVNPVTVNSDSFLVSSEGLYLPGKILFSNRNTIATFVPDQTLPLFKQITVTLTTDITDVSGNPMVSTFTSSFTTAPSTDNFQPMVVSVSPESGARNVPLNTIIQVVFSERLDPLTVNDSTFYICENYCYNRVNGTIVLSDDGMVATFTPDKPLLPNTQYGVNVTTGIKDVAGNPLYNSYSSSFRTLNVSKISPENGAENIPLNTIAQVVFTESIDPLALNSESFYLRSVWGVVSGKITVSNNNTIITFTPDSVLLPNTYYSVYLFGSSISSFRTGETLTDDTGPVVRGISPESGATGVPLNANVVVEFSEPVAGTTVSDQTVVVSSGGVVVPGEIMLERGGRVVRWKPANLELLKADTLYEVTVTTGITDLAGNPLQAQYTAFFTTGSVTDNEAPAVVSVSPVNNSQDIALDTPIVITFSEPINPAFIAGAISLRGGGVDGSIEGVLSLSADRKTVTFKPDYPLFAGQWYYVKLNNCWSSGNINRIEDVAGNKMSCETFSFKTAIATGTDTSTLPNRATVTVNPRVLYADGVTTTTVMITNINRGGELVPNGTKVAVSVGSAYRVNSAGGTIVGGLPAADPRFRIFETLGGGITLTYQSADLRDLLPGQSATADIQVAQVDAGGNPVSLIGVGAVTLVRGRTATVKTNPRELLVGAGSYAEIEVVVRYNYGNPVTEGTEVGITAEPVYERSSAGGSINGGSVGSDSRFRVFKTGRGGVIKTTYSPPASYTGDSGWAYIQVVSIGSEGQVTGLLGRGQIKLSTTAGSPAPQPEVLSVSPDNGATGVALNAVITATFSQALDSATINSTNFSVRRGSTAVAGTISLSSDGKVVSFEPSEPLMPNSSYSVYIGRGIKSVEGNELLDYRYVTFSTGVAVDETPPEVIRVNPADGAGAVGTNTVVEVQFSEQMDVSSINEISFRVLNGGVEIPGKITISSGNRKVIFTPDELLEPMTEYTINISSTVRDVAGNEMGVPFTSRFTTGEGVDNFQPMVVSVSPENGANGVPVDTTVTITFSEPMNPLTINSSTFYIRGPGYYDIVNGTIILENGNTTATFIPTYPLFAGASYTVYVEDEIKDVSGNPLISSFTSRFTAAETPNPEVQPTGATVTVNPRSIFANGNVSTTIIVSNINRNGTPVPNGTVIAVTAEPAFVQNTVGGSITGSSIGTSPDARFLLFKTYGAKIEFSYTPPDLTGMKPGATASGVIQIASVDGDNRPVRLVAQGTVNLYHVRSATVIASPDRFTIGQQGSSIITVTVKDYKNLVPDGTRVGLTVAPIFVSSTMGGAIEGGVTSSADSRVQIFTTTGGKFTATYLSPTQISQAGTETIQVVTVDKDGHVTGLINTATIYFVQ